LHAQHWQFWSGYDMATIRRTSAQLFGLVLRRWSQLQSPPSGLTNMVALFHEMHRDREA